MIEKRILALAAAQIGGFAVSALLGQFAMAQYPVKPVKVVVPFAPGGWTDLGTRAVMTELSKRKGQNFVVENRPGGGGNIGVEYVAQAAPDGYTLLTGSGAVATAPSMYAKPTVDPTKDLAPIIVIFTLPSVLAVHPGLPAKSLSELVSLAKAKPGQYNYASTGFGGTPHLCGEFIKGETGMNLVHVPYKGGGPASLALLSGEIQVYCTGVTTVVPYIGTNKLRVISVIAPQRTLLLPDVATAAEQGYKGLEVNSWLGYMAPAKTPAPVIETLYQDILNVATAPEIVKYAATQGAEPYLMDPQKMGTYLKDEIAKWAKVVKNAGIKPE